MVAFLLVPVDALQEVPVARALAGVLVEMGQAFEVSFGLPFAPRCGFVCRPSSNVHNDGCVRGQLQKVRFQTLCLDKLEERDYTY